jgi:hypothetical protein
MNITYEITPADVHLYSAEAEKGTSLFKVYSRLITILIILFVFGDILVGFVSVAYNGGSARIDAVSMVPRIIIAVMIMGILFIGSKLWSKHAMKKFLSTPGKNGCFCEHTITLDDEGFTESTEVNRGFQSWEGVEGVTQTDHFVTIKIRLGAGHFIPKRIFASKGHVYDFIEAVESHLPEEARKFKR